MKPVILESEDELIICMLEHKGFNKSQKFFLLAKVGYLWCKPFYVWQTGYEYKQTYNLKFEFNFYNPITLIFLALGIPIVLIESIFREIPIKAEFKALVERCPNKKLYCNKENIEYYRQKAMAYL